MNLLFTLFSVSSVLFQWMPYCPADHISISILLLISQAVECLSGMKACHRALHSLRLLHCNPTADSSSSEAVHLPSGPRCRLLHAKSIMATIIHRCSVSLPPSVSYISGHHLLFLFLKNEHVASCLFILCSFFWTEVVQKKKPKKKTTQKKWTIGKVITSVWSQE